MTQVSRQETPTFTAFTEDFGNFNNRSMGWEDISLQAVIDKAAAFCGGSTPIAWAQEGTAGYGGTKSFAQLRIESIAAGRLIELVDGKYVARGVPMEEAPKRVETLGDLLRQSFKKPQYISFDWAEDAEPSPADAAMIARDGPAKFDPRAFPKECERMTKEALGTAKPNPFHAYRSPDQCQGPADHLNASRHQMAAKQFHKA